jgi:hypothetical protein
MQKNEKRTERHLESLFRKIALPLPCFFSVFFPCLCSFSAEILQQIFLSYFLCFPFSKECLAGTSSQQLESNDHHKTRDLPNPSPTSLSSTLMIRPENIDIY